MPVDRRDRHRQAGGEDGGRRPISPGCSPATATSWSSRWGAGGPPEPELIERPPERRGARRALPLGPPRRLRPSRDRRRRPACRRSAAAVPAGASPGGRSSRTSATARGSRPTAAPDIVVFDGSGTAIPPVAADRRVLVVGPGHDLDAPFDLYRRLVSDLVVSVGCEVGGRDPGALRLRPLGPLEGRVAVFAAGPAETGAPRRRRRPRLAEPRRPRRAARGARDARRRHLSDRAQGRRDRPRRRARARPRPPGRARRERRRRAGARRGAARARPGGGDRLMQPHYRDPLPLGDPDGLPYSKGMMARALVSAGVGIESAYVIATRLELDLIATGAQAVELERLEETAARGARRGRGASASCSASAGSRRCEALDVPIVLLVGGATGTGKSTVATEAAHRLGITRVTSTDFIRQTIRAYFPPSRCRRCTPRASRQAARSERRGGLPRADPPRARRRRGVDRARADRGLVDGDRGRPPRAGDGSPPRSRGRCSSTRCFTCREHRGAPRATSSIRDSATGGTRALDKYIDGLDEIRVLQELIVERAERTAFR